MFTLVILSSLVWIIQLCDVVSFKRLFRHLYLRLSHRSASVFVLTSNQSIKRYAPIHFFKKTRQSVGLLVVAWTILGGTLNAQIRIDNLLTTDTVVARRTLENHFDGKVLLLNESTLQNLVDKQPKEWVITIPSDEVEPLTLKLKKQTLFTDDFIYNSSDNDLPSPEIDLHYTGFVENYPNSTVAFSLNQTTVSGLIRLPSKVVAIQKLATNTKNNHVVYNYKNRSSRPILECENTDSIASPPEIKAQRKRITDDPVCVSIRVEVDYDFRGNATSLMNQVASIYQDIGIDIKISEIYQWNRPSPYQGSSRKIIQQLQTNLKKQDDLSGDLTLFITARGNGGRASTVGSVCEPTSVCYSGQNDDVYTIAHELGHLFSSHHTHSCKWNGNNTALDGCGHNAGYGGCPGNDPAEGGTIMSYCHIRSVGIRLEFHSQVAGKMYNFLKSNSDCTCKNPSSSIEEVIEEEIELEEEEEEEEEYEETSKEEGENIIANICRMSFINPNNCTIDIHALNNGEQGDLLLSIPAQTTASSPIIKSLKYGIYSEGVLLGQFTATCGTVHSIASCGSEGDRVTGKVIMEGFYDVYSGEMHQQLLKENLLSKTNPYLQAPWNYKGITEVKNIPTNAVDWILIMSRNLAGEIIGQSVGFFSTTGQLMDVHGKLGIPLVGANKQYFSIHHRGHMAVMTASPYQTGTDLDFTASEKSVMGNGQLKPVGKIFALHAGDYDANGVINNMDYNHWVSNSSKINLYIPSDGDGNGVINNKDYNLWIANRSKIGHNPLHY